MSLKFNPEIWFPRKKFIPGQWLRKPEQENDFKYSGSYVSNRCIEYDIEVIIGRIEAHQLDLTLDYQDWVKLGFAFSNEFGESGRVYFHRISRFHPEYNTNNCNRQFDQCLKSNGRKVTIKSFLGMARDAGVNIVVPG